MELTQKELKRLLNYDPETGFFWWKVRPSNNIYVGDRAGHVQETKGYRNIHIKGKLYKAHRLAWLYCYGAFPEGNLDHINRDRDDNRISNLRVAPGSLNNYNSGISRNNTSGVKGVSYNKGAGKWEAGAGSRPRIYLGIFSSKEDAIKARKAWEIKNGLSQ